MGSSTDTSMASETDNKLPKGISHVITNFRLKRFVWHIIQSAPAALLEMSMWFMTLAGIALCYGAVIQSNRFLVILCLDLSSMIARGICWGFSLPLKPFPANRSVTLLLQFAAVIFVSYVFCCIRSPDCDPLLLAGIIIAHLIAIPIVEGESNACEYDPSKLQLKVVTTSIIRDRLPPVLLIFAGILWVGNGINDGPFNHSVERFARIQDQGGKYLAEDPQCIKDLNQCITAMNNLRKHHNQSVDPLPQFDLDGQLDLTVQLVGREAQAVKCPVDQVTEELNQHTQKLFNPSAPIAPFLKAYKTVHDNPHCVDALKQFEGDINQPDRNKQCAKDGGDFLKGFDEFVEAYDKRTNRRWVAVALIGLLLISNLCCVGQQVFIMKTQAAARDTWVEFWDKCLHKTIIHIVECILTRYPLSFITAFFLCVRILCGWTADKQSIVAVILCMFLMFVIASTFYEIPKLATANADAEDIQLGYIDSGHPIAGGSPSNTCLQFPSGANDANSSPSISSNLGIAIPKLEYADPYPMASTESSTPAPSISRSKLGIAIPKLEYADPYPMAATESSTPAPSISRRNLGIVIPKLEYADPYPMATKSSTPAPSISRSNLGIAIPKLEYADPYPMATTESSTPAPSISRSNLGIVIPKLEYADPYPMASTESSAPSHSQGNLVNASQSGDSSVQHTPSSSTHGFPKSGSSNPRTPS